MIRLPKYIEQIRLNRVIQFMTYSDLLMISGWGLIAPILAVFITEQIPGANVEVAGLAATIFFFVKSIGQIPVARWIDSRRGEWDDYIVLIGGSLLICLAAFLYIGAHEIWHVFTLQAVYGIGSAMAYPSWMAIFTRHIDKDSEGFQWSIYFTAIDMGSALTAGLGGLIAERFGYQSLFAVVGTLSVIGTLFLGAIGAQLKVRRRRSSPGTAVLS